MVTYDFESSYWTMTFLAPSGDLMGCAVRQTMFNSNMIRITLALPLNSVTETDVYNRRKS